MEENVEQVVVPKITLDAVNYIAELTKYVSPFGHVETDQDWLILVKLFDVWVNLFPLEYNEFLTTISQTKGLNADSKGFTKDKEFRHQMEIPERYHQLIKSLYPLQPYNTEFTQRLVKEIPILGATS
jgi:hypothetical protein